MQPIDHVEAAQEAVALMRTKGRLSAAKILKAMGKNFGGKAFADDLAGDRDEFAIILGVEADTVEWMAQRVLEGVAH